MPTLTKDGRRLPGTGSNWCRPARRRALYQRDGWRCGWCRKNLRNRPKERTLDHITPRALGGGHEDGNLVMACKRCNDSRQHRVGFHCNPTPALRERMKGRAGFMVADDLTDTAQPTAEIKAAAKKWFEETWASRASKAPGVVAVSEPGDGDFLRWDAASSDPLADILAARDLFMGVTVTDTQEARMARIMNHPAPLSDVDRVAERWVCLDFHNSRGGTC